ncbi:MAG: YggS family pyridoxal phosphate-dependent enzyme, partial [Actinomycetes bacterium]
RRDEITVIAVTKTFPVSDVHHLAALGLTDLGENRDQDAAAKAADAAAQGLTGLRWHFVGQLQTNKAGSVARYADVVHSVDRHRLVDALARGAQRHGRTLTCLVQVDLDERAEHRGRGGAPPADVAMIAEAVEEAPGLVLGGVMAVAPRHEDTRETAAAFGRLAELAGELRTSYPHARMVSAGMSGDLEAAICHGATHLRVGAALLGSRPPLG